MVAAKLANMKRGANQHTIEDMEISISSAAKMLNWQALMWGAQKRKSPKFR
jgi:hypothetical protein